MELRYKPSSLLNWPSSGRSNSSAWMPLSPLVDYKLQCINLYYNHSNHNKHIIKSSQGFTSHLTRVRITIQNNSLENNY